MDIKSEKSKSFWGGVLTGSAVVGVILTLVTCGVLFYQSTFYTKLLTENTHPAGSSSGSSSVKTGDFNDADFADKTEDIYDVILENFLFEENVDKSKIQDKVYAAMMEALDDPYSVYYTREEFEDLFEETAGTYCGIGSYVTLDESGMVLLSGVFEGSPAAQAGLRDGDMISAVNGESIIGRTLTECVSLIKGERYTEVTVTVVREGEAAPFDLVVIRDRISVPTVTYEMMDDKIGYLQITEFDDVTVDQFNEAYKDLNKQGMEAMILDLRSNPGGNLDTVLSICEEILPKGIITYTIDKKGNKYEYSCNGKNKIKIPLVVLVNEYSASASELMTGAIRDYGVGTIMGTNTFGKGIVQHIFQLGDGTGIKMTTSRYYTPSGECIHGNGIAPDIEVEFDSEAYYAENSVDNQLEAARDYLKKQMNK